MKHRPLLPRLIPSALLALTFLALPYTAFAEPQANLGMRLGLAGIGTTGFWSDTRFHLGAHGDVLLGRKSNSDFGIGPYAEALTNWGDLQFGGGASILLPVHSYLPLVLSGGGYARHASATGWNPGFGLELFWGSRSYNYTSPYVMAGGLIVQARQGVGEVDERSLVIAIHVDGEVLSLPFVLLFEAVRGPRSH